MPLPTLDVPTYVCDLPSTGAKIKYRPFLVREHKILMTLSDADVNEISRGVIDIVDACTFKKLDIKKLSHFDIEFLFLQLRSKSIGEAVELVVNCPCGEKIPHTASIEDIKVNKTEGFSNKIMITNNVGVVMRFPKFEEVFQIYYNEEQDVNLMFNMVKSCIDGVYDSEEYFEVSSISDEQLDDFLNSFTREQFDKLEKFFTDMPKVVHTIETDCPSCGKHNVVNLEGLQNFFV